ncbi:unnamed protein product [Moneuplotes crassus]|uniref:FAD-binding FR-type domain-containing protein n=1 Tax=Euplotes crassus TaxID=5936 RepID=A0AAD1XWJ5_EUPCR|nr:unnamed protein product [Moneuplotes crassus]
MEDSKIDESTMHIHNEDANLLKLNNFEEKVKHLPSDDRPNTGEEWEEEKDKISPLKITHHTYKDHKRNSFYTRPVKLMNSSRLIKRRLKDARTNSLSNLHSIKSTDDIMRKKNNRKNPSSHIQRVFGPRFKFSEKLLISKMDNMMIKKSLLEIFKLKTLTRENLKYILREGADTNNILRITDECFEKMVDVLNIPLDSDSEDTDDAVEVIQNFDGNEESSKDGEPLKNQASQKNSDQMSLGPQGEKSVTNTSVYEITHRHNKLIQAKGCLQKLISLEKSEMTEKSKTKSKKHKDNCILPGNPDDNFKSLNVANQDCLKLKFKYLVEDILKKRTNIHKNQDQFIDPRDGTVVESELEGDITDYVKASAGDCSDTFNCLVEAKKPYYKLYTILTIIALISFFIMAAISSSYSYSDFIGTWVVISRGSASSILGLTGILMLLVSYDLLTYIRSKCKGRCQLWLNHNILLHRFCGYLITFFSIVHVVGHLSGSIKKFSEAKDIDNVNEVTLNHNFDGKKTYAELLFLTLPGITGILLIIIIIAIAITSTSWFRERYFQTFALIHVAGFPLFLGLIILHGCEGWFNWGFPLGAIFLAPPIIISTIQFIQRLRTINKFKFRIGDVNISQNKRYIMIFFIKPRGFTIKKGQYVFINIPQVSCSQWHPFTVASCPDSKFITVMMKRAGDWTGKLIDILFEQKKAMMRMSELDIDTYEEKDVFNVLHDIYDEIKVKEMMNINKRYFLYANISRPITSACEAYDNKNVVLVGAGSGIAPFLPLVDEIIRFDQGKSHSYDFKSATLVFIAREGEQVSWISNYILHLLSTDIVTSFFNIKIYITLKRNSETVPSFLFWRAFLLICKNNIDMNFEEDKENENEDNNSISCRLEELKGPRNNLDSENLQTISSDTSPISIKFGRPNFTKICKELIAKNELKYDVYACVPKVLANHLHYVFAKMKKESGVVFNLILESFY